MAEGWKALRVSYRKLDDRLMAGFEDWIANGVNKNGPTLAKDQGEAFPTPEQLETAIRMNGGAPLAA